MKICFVHNSYGVFGGEDAAVARMAALLADGGCEVVRYERSTVDMIEKPFGSVRAFFSGLANFGEARRLRDFLKAEKPDVVQFQNIYPVISPQAFKVTAELGIATVMRCSNYRLFCPTGLLMSKLDGRICTRCPDSWEIWCLLKNCERSRLKSFGYALRTFVARKRRVILDNVDMFFTPCGFVRDRFTQWDIDGERIDVVPTPVERPDSADIENAGDYIAFVGRVSYEKGVDVLVQAHNKDELKDIPMQIAGDYSPMPHLPREAGDNVQWLGLLDHSKLGDFYRNARVIVVPSVCHEVFPNVALEAMRHGRPVIGTTLGGIPEVVADGRTGLLVRPGDSGDLAEKILKIYSDTDLARRMGRAGLERAASDFSPERCYQRLMAVYEKAIENRNRKA